MLGTQPCNGLRGFLAEGTVSGQVLQQTQSHGSHRMTSPGSRSTDINVSIEAGGNSSDRVSISLVITARQTAGNPWI
jgi:hypothetical protein